MSAFFVNREVIHDTCRLWVELDKQPRSVTTLTSIGRQLWAMNRSALLLRYRGLTGSAEDDNNRRMAENYHYILPDVSIAQMTKSAHCLRYQCGEGDIGEGNEQWDPLYHALTRLCDAVGRPDGYDAATWDRG